MVMAMIRCRRASKRATAPEVAAFSEPISGAAMGMDATRSHCFRTRGRSPLSSLPMTRARGWVRSVS